MGYFKELASIVGSTIPDTPEKSTAFLELYQNHTASELTSIFKVKARTLRKWRARSEKITGVKHNHVPEGQKIKGVSVMTDAQGNEILRWTKTKEGEIDQEDQLRSILESFKNDIARTGKTPKPQITNDKLATLYTITDYHLGKMAEGDNLAKQKDRLIKFFSYMIDKQPDSEVAVLSIMGDFLDFDGLDPVTPRSGHILAANCTYHEMIKACFDIIRTIIDMLLRKHTYVRFYMIRGNHDQASAIVIREAFNLIYEKEPRITVDDTDIHFHAFEWGNVSLFMAHGDNVKMKDLPEIFAAYHRDIYGRTKYAYGHCGHYHHQIKLEHRLMIMEQHTTLSPKSNHDKDKGYNSMRSQSVITYHKDYGEVKRDTATPEMLK